MESRVTKRAVLFDFDGVICQTETFRMDRLKASFEKMGLTVDKKRLYQLVGGTRQERAPFMDQIFEGQENYLEHRDEILSLKWPVPPYGELATPGVSVVLGRLKEEGYKIAVASNSRTDMLEDGLSQCGLCHLVDVVVSGWDAGRRKPDPYVYQEAMRRLGVTPGEAIIIEDSPIGIQAGKAAGSQVIALRDREGMLDQSGGDGVIETLNEIFSYLPK